MSWTPGSTAVLQSTDAEPSRVYGFIALVDPRTHQEHLILNHDFDPPIVVGYPYLLILYSATARLVENNGQ